MNAVESDLLFTQDENGIYRWDKSKDLDKIVADRSKNTFIKIKYHWSEDPTKDEEWYNKQCQELDDQRLINQELDLYFVGGTNCIFKDETLANFKSKEQEKTVDTPHFSKLKIFEEELSRADYYLIGCDTAESLEGAYCAIQIFSFRNFKQIAEVQDKYGSYTAFADVIDFVFNWLRGIVGDNIILCIENNSIGRFDEASIKFCELLEHPENQENYNATRKSNRDSLKISWIGQSAAKVLMIYFYGQGSTTIPEGSRS